MTIGKYNKGWKFPRNNREKSVVNYSTEQHRTISMSDVVERARCCSRQCVVGEGIGGMVVRGGGEAAS